MSRQQQATPGDDSAPTTERPKGPNTDCGPEAIINLVLPDGTSGDFFMGRESWADFCRRKGKPEFIHLHKHPERLS